MNITLEQAIEKVAEYNNWYYPEDFMKLIRQEIDEEDILTLFKGIELYCQSQKAQVWQEGQDAKGQWVAYGTDRSRFDKPVNPYLETKKDQDEKTNEKAN